VRICFRIVCLKTIDTGASSWLFYFCILILARYKNEKKRPVILDKGNNIVHGRPFGGSGDIARVQMNRRTDGRFNAAAPPDCGNV